MSEHAPSTHRTPPFDPAAITRAASDALNVRRVFGEAYERDGSWVIPVATMTGGTGSGFGVGFGATAPSGGDAPGTDGAGAPPGEGSGGGGGLMVRVRPIGVYVVDASGVHWRPAIDVNRAILGGQAVGVVVSLAIAWALRRRWR